MYVKETFTYIFSHGGAVTVPAGARTASASAHGGFRWVDPTVFYPNTIERHDAAYYGIRVYPDNLTETPA
jgi:hypothetical protein